MGQTSGVWSTVRQRNARIKQFEREQERRAASVADPEHYNFRIATSCPPDLRLHLRGGLMYSMSSHDCWFVPDTIIDFTNPDHTGGGTFIYTNPAYSYYYQGHLLRLDDGGSSAPYTFSLTNSGNPFANPGDAEQDLLDYMELGFEWIDDYPLCGVIIRNDGRVNTPYSIMPIDRINRGRSYIWPADFRPRSIAL